MFAINTLLALFFVGSAQQIGINELNPSVGECFGFFSKRVIEPNLPKGLDVSGALLSVLLEPNNETFPIHVISYDLNTQDEQKQRFILYAQFGECEDTKNNVVQINNDDPHSFGEVFKSFMQCLGCRCAYWACNDPFKFDAEFHIFGNKRQGTNYQKVLMDRFRIANECSFLCPQNLIQDSQLDTSNCKYKVCTGYCGGPQNPDSPEICSIDFVKIYPDKNNMTHYSWIPLVLILVFFYYLGARKLCERFVDRGLNLALEPVAQLD